MKDLHSLNRLLMQFNRCTFALTNSFAFNCLLSDVAAVHVDQQPRACHDV